MPIKSRILLLTLIVRLLMPGSLSAQHSIHLSYSNQPFRPAQNLNDTILPETNCSNGIDDNGDGLIDLDESHCYYDNELLNRDCRPTSILWACSSVGISWKNLATREERLVCLPPDQDFFVDIAWAPDGMLYAACESGNIYKVDPLSGFLTPAYLFGVYQLNGMTIDGAGILYLTAYLGQQTCDLLKINPVTHELEKMVRLSDYGLLASGDCCFLNGFLYVSCKGYIARVDINTKLVQKLKINNILVDDSYGITTLGDGYLYLSNNIADIYRLDPVTMQDTLISRFKQPGMAITGYASYVDACNAPCATPLISLGSDTTVCSNGSTLLTAQADRTVSSYAWSNGDTTKAITISTPGIYWVRVRNKCDTNSDTIIVSAADKPLVSLGSDTLLCLQTSIILTNRQMTQSPVHLLWSDNSSAPILTVTTPGKYWLKVSNGCGDATDTIQISPKIDSCECYLYIPTAFTPNNDHRNDLFKTFSNCLLKGNIKIFNRWGQIVYSSENLDVGWDGVRDGKRQPQGAYVYTIWFNYKDRPGLFMRKGSVVLIR